MPHKNERKLIPIGKSSLAIVLPKPWLRYYGLKKKDALRVISNGSIIIEAPKKRKDGVV